MSQQAPQLGLARHLEVERRTRRAGGDGKGHAGAGEVAHQAQSPGEQGGVRPPAAAGGGGGGGYIGVGAGGGDVEAGVAAPGSSVLQQAQGPGV